MNIYVIKSYDRVSKDQAISNYFYSSLGLVYRSRQVLIKAANKNI